MENTKKSNKKIIKNIISVVTMIAITCLTLYYILKENPQQTLAALIDAKLGFIFIMVGLIILAFILEGLAITVLAKLYYKKYHLYQGVFTGLIGTFFSSITPFASGGQFAQVYTFSRQKIKSSSSASILVMLFIVSQFAIIVYGILSISIGYNTTIRYMNDFSIFSFKVSPMIFSTLGFIFNIFILTMLIALAYLKHLHHFILTKGINLAYKLHLVKNPDRKRTEIAASIATFRIELTRLFKNIWILIIIFIIEFLKFTCMFSLPFFAGLSLNIDKVDYLSFHTYFQCLWSTSYLFMISSLNPVPGGTGLAETFFQLLFSSIFENMTSAANILYRGISFYFALVCGGLVFTFYRASPKKATDLKDLKKTFVDLKIVSLVSTSELPILSELEDNEKAYSDEKLKKIKRKKNFFNYKLKDINTSSIVDDSNKYVSHEEIQKSFNELKNNLLKQNDYEIEQEDNQTNYISKSYLSNVYKEMEDIENDIKKSNKTDTEIQLAIKKDLEELINEEKRRKAKKIARRQRRLIRKNRREGK